MTIAVLGTGMVGSAIARKLKDIGEDVIAGSRDPDGRSARALVQHGIAVKPYPEAIASSDMLVNALDGEIALEILENADLSGRTIFDIGNFRSAIDGPLEETLGETLQAAHPKAKVVKALNSVAAHLMVDPAHLPGAHVTYLAGNDEDAKAEVLAILKRFGWSEVIDLGDLTASRAIEQIAPLWVRLETVLGGSNFNFAVLRGPQPENGD